MIYITGDTHGSNNIFKLFPGSFPTGKTLSRDDYMIIAGDFGGIWDGGLHDKDVLDFYRDKNYTTLFVDGNHENFVRLNSYPTEIWNGGKIHRVDDNIIHLMRGQVYEIEGKKIFTFGGGISIDKNWRIPYISWWPEEWPSRKEIDEALDNLAKHNNKVDCVITHAAPEIVKNEVGTIIPLQQIECQTEKFLNELYSEMEFTYWFCGHYHIDVNLESLKTMVLYNNIIELSDGYPIVSKS